MRTLRPIWTTGRRPVHRSRANTSGLTPNHRCASSRGSVAAARGSPGEVLLPRGRAHAWAEASGRGSHGRGSTSQELDVQCGGQTRTADRSGLVRHRGDSVDEIC